MKELLIATTNPAKLREYKELLKNTKIKLVFLKELKIKNKAKENGRTFQENAIKKAKFYSELSGLPTLADDGGLEIDYLNGEPGLKSRRWPGHEATDQELIDLALKKLKGVPWNKRKAQFRVVLALALPGRKIITFEGRKRGIMLNKTRGKLIPGYPFRSLFYLPRYGKTFNQLSFKDEIRIGHRRKPINKLIEFLKSKWNSF